MANSARSSFDRTHSQLAIPMEDFGLDRILHSSDIVNTDYITNQDYSSQDEAPTRLKQRSKSNKPGGIMGPRLTSVTTKEIEDTSAPIYQRIFRGPQDRDVEAEAASTNEPAIQSSLTARPPDQIYEIMHNWTQSSSSQNPESTPTISVVKRPANEAHSIQGNVGWLHKEDHHPSINKLEMIVRKYLTRQLPAYIRETTNSLLRRVVSTKEKSFVFGKFLTPGPVRYDGRLFGVKEEDHPCTFMSFPYIAVGTFKSEPGDTSHLSSQAHVNVGRASNTHPVQTLVQNRYRLQSTKKRDANQSITSLTRQEVEDCISSRQKSSRPAKKGRWKRKIYVPQFWCLSISGDTMITNGPISEVDLRGSALSVSSLRAPASHPDSQPTIVRFNVQVDGKPESFIYPADRCRSYFSLLNKERRISATLDEQKNKAHNATGVEEVIRYQLFWRLSPVTSKQLITSDNWINILRDAQVDQLDIYLESEKIADRDPQPDITVTPVSSDTLQVNSTRLHRSASLSALSPILRTTDPEGHQTNHSNSVMTSARLTIPNHVRSVSSNSETSNASRSTVRYLTHTKPLFEWRLPKDIERDSDWQPAKRVQLWLDKISKSITPARVNSTAAVHQLDDCSMGFSLIRPSRRRDVANVTFPDQSQYQSTANGTVPGQGCVAASVAHEVGSSQNPGDGSVDNTSVNRTGQRASFRGEHIFDKARYLLSLYVYSDDPQAGKWDASDHAVILQYWGLIAFLLEKLKDPDQDTLLKAMNTVVGLTELLHKGVRRYRCDDAAVVDVEAIEYEDSAVMQMPVAVAFEYFLCFLSDAVAYASKNVSNPAPGGATFEQATGKRLVACVKSLKLAQNYLITIADDSELEQDLGPIVTPEAVLLLLIERLARGVYKDGNIDIIEVYERVMEKLASKVEANASRRLLLELGRVSEELDIILKVLRQQEHALVGYRDILDPKNFDFPTMKRRTRFPFEKHAINRILKDIKERITDCDELRKRAADLAVQNVRLVESYQDDNNKTLLVFTVVTITFLPLSTVTSFFGMNLKGISDTDSSVRHFWTIAIPITLGVVIVSTVLAFWSVIERRARDFREYIRGDDQE